MSGRDQPPMLHDSLSVADAFRLIALDRLQHFTDRAQEFGDIGGAAVLHQCRIAIRELRSALVLFRPMLDVAAAGRFRAELRWMAAQLDDARNLDVLLARHFEGNGQHAGPLLDRLLVVHEAAYAQATAAAASRRREQLVGEMNAWLNRDVSGGVHGQDNIGPFAERALERSWRRVTRRAAGRLLSMTSSQRHRLRVRVKTLRYGVGFFRSLYADRDRAVDRMMKRLAAAQACLGAINDLTMTKDVIDRLGLAARERQAARWLLGEVRQAQDKKLQEGDRRIRQLVVSRPFWQR